MEESKTLEILMEIRENVATLTEKFSHLETKMSENTEKYNQELDSVRTDVDELKKEVAELKNKDNREDAHKWRKASGYVFAVLGTTVVTFLLSHIGDLIRALGGN